jgi:pilus assembly protein CpaB
MNQSKAFLISFLFAGLAMLLVFVYVNDVRTEEKAKYGDEIVVVVAARDINEMEQIQATMLTTKVVPNAFKQPGSDPDPKTFEGAVSAAPVKAGEQILLTKVLLKGSSTGISGQVAIHHRAISIPVNDVTGVTRLLRPGDRVDIIANVQYNAGAGMESEVKTVLQNVHVLAVGELVQNNVPQAFETDPVSGNRRAMNLRGNRSFNTVTVEVVPTDAQKLIFVSEGTGASLYLTLRNPVDRQIASVPTVTVDEVLGENSKKAEKARNKPVAAAPPPPKAKVVAPPPPPPAFSQGGIPVAN